MLNHEPKGKSIQMQTRLCPACLVLLGPELAGTRRTADVLPCFLVCVAMAMAVVGDSSVFFPLAHLPSLSGCDVPVRGRNSLQFASSTATHNVPPSDNREDLSSGKEVPHLSYVEGNVTSTPPLKNVISQQTDCSAASEHEKEAGKRCTNGGPEAAFLSCPPSSDS